MANVEPIEFWTPSGWITLGCKPVDSSTGPWEIYTPSGWYAPNVTSLSESNTPIELYTPSGWVGVRGDYYTLITSFEESSFPDGWLANYAGFTQATIDPYHGKYIARVVKSSGGYHGSAIADGTDVNYLPVKNDIFAGRIRLSNSGCNAGVLFGAQDARSSYPDGYHLEVDQRYNDTLHLSYENDSTGYSNTWHLDTINLSGHYDTWLDLVAYWQSNGVVGGELYAADGTLLASGGVDMDNYSSVTQFTSGYFGISFDTPTGSSGVVDHDFWRKVGTA